MFLSKFLLKGALHSSKIGCIQFLWAGAKKYKFPFLLCSVPLNNHMVRLQNTALPENVREYGPDLLQYYPAHGTSSSLILRSSWYMLPGTRREHVSEVLLLNPIYCSEYRVLLYLRPDENMALKYSLQLASTTRWAWKNTFQDVPILLHVALKKIILIQKTYKLYFIYYTNPCYWLIFSTIVAQMCIQTRWTSYFTQSIL